jgi:hypothetical protein
MDVMTEVPSGMLIEQFVEKPLPCMAKRGMPDVMSEGDRLDQIKVKMQGAADGPRDPGNELHVQASARDIVVSIEGENLRFIGIAVIIRTVQYLIDVADERRSPDAGIIVRIWPTANNVSFIEGNLFIAPVSRFPRHAKRKLLG